MNILGIGRETDSDIVTAGYFATIRLCAEIENRCLAWERADKGTLFLRETILGGTDGLFTFKPVLAAEQVERIASGGSRKARRP